MNYIDQLIHQYEEFAALPWNPTLAGPQRVWFVVYNKTEERRLRARLEEFQIATKRTNHGWTACDLADSFAKWMAAHRYRDAYFAAPKKLVMPPKDFQTAVTNTVIDVLKQADDNAVVALYGIGALYGFMRTSDLLKAVQDQIRGRLLVFFPGQYENNTYRLLDARDGWNYLAVPITAYKGVAG